MSNNISDLLKNKELLSKMVMNFIEKNDLQSALYLINHVDDVETLKEFVKTFKIPLPKKEDLLSKYPDSAYIYAYYGLGKKRFYKGEPAILRSPHFALLYTKNVIEDRWLAAEPIIATNPEAALEYARTFRFRFKEGENAIIRNNEILKKYLNHLKEINEEKAFYKDHPLLFEILKHSQDEINFVFEEALKEKDTEILEKLLPYISEPYLALKYVQEIAKRRVPEIEHLIARDVDLIMKYIEIIKEPFELGHNIIARYPEYAYKYALILGKAFPEGEDAIATNAEYSYLYAKNVIKGRFPKGEGVISKNPKYAFYYIRDIIKDRVRQWEPLLREDDGVWEQYLEFLREIGKYTEWWIEEEKRLKKQKKIEYEQHLREQQDKYYEEQQAKLEEEEKERKKKEKNEEESGWDTEIQESLF
jgi:hypothetical protein